MGIADLNREQAEAVLAGPGTDLVLAGAGTGKTRTLVEKIRRIVAKDLPPENLLVLTFSRKAAGEIRERAEQGLGTCGRGLSAGTFHSFCWKFLRENRDPFLAGTGYREFPSVLGEEQGEALLNELFCSEKHRFLGLPAGLVLGLLRGGRPLSRPVRIKLERFGLLEEAARLGRIYAGLKKERNLIEFEDMIEETIHLLEREESVRRAARERFRYVLVDEFQDTSENNMRLLRLLLPGKEANLFAVGDDWQSIYGFRSARVDYIVNMRAHFPGVRVHRLEKNYRSRREIVRASNRFIRKNRFRTRKNPVSARGKGGLVRHRTVPGIEEEVSEIRKILTAERAGGSIAVLYRNNAYGSFLARRLAELDESGVEGITFLTMHSSKGLEFDTVIIAGISDAIIPDPDSDLEEERRLFYVALTRARERLFLLSRVETDGSLPLFARELGFRG